MKLFLLSLWFLVLSSVVGFSQALLDDPEDKITHLFGNRYALTWHGHAGNTYFIQTTSGEVADNSLVWEYIPDIRYGTDQQLGMGFEVPSDFQKRFYRLQYTNQEVAIDHNLDDFDGDGFTNLEEVFANTNPILSQSHPPTTDDEPEGGPGDEEGQGFQLIHIVNGVSIFYSYEAGSSIPVFPIYRGAGMTK